MRETQRNAMKTMWLAALSLLIAVCVLERRSETRSAVRSEGAAAVTAQAVATSDPAVIGSWGPRFGLPLIAIHATVLPTGRVLLFSSVGASTTAGSAAWIWDPGTGTLTDVSVPYTYDMMCGGNTLLADGQVYVVGGRISAEKTALFNPATRTWTPGPSMPLARYYPTALELPDGTVPIFYGRTTTVELYDPQTNRLTMLPASANRDVGLYPRLHVLPSGKLFHAGPEQQTSIFDPATSTWSPMGQMTFGPRNDATTVLLPGLSKVLTAGGTKGSGITGTAEIIDFAAAAPQWRAIFNMRLARTSFNMVLLPDGTVLVVGGRGPSVIPKQAELFDPATETWTLMAAQVAQRAYHSTAVLLPDGRVLSAGDGDSNRLTGEVFSPPYLFKGARPTISNAPGSLGYGELFAIAAPDAASIARVALIKPGPVSHGVNHDQRYVILDFTVAGPEELSAMSPAGPTLAPPGWYMLFIVNSVGVPSVASWVHLANAADAVCTQSAPTVTAAPTQGPAVEAGATVPYTISVKNNDTAACTASSFGLVPTVPDGWQGIFTQPTLTLASGATGATTLNVTSAPSPPAEYAIVATATRTVAPADAASASMTYTVANPSGGGGSFTDDFNRATLGSNWQVIQGAMSIQNNELRNGATAGLHAAVVPAISLANATVTARFASTLQSTGIPTFGLILRYQNPTNYYLLYRQAGGTSVLRIAKVVNGVTTVLASSPITNPQLNVFFQVTATAAGSKLTITQGAVTVSATDATFANGAVGILMGSTNAAASHRADDFAVTPQ